MEKLIPIQLTYIKQRPAMFSFIRPQEAYLFRKYKKFIHAPILDFGCGDGFFAQTTFGKNYIDVGVDIHSNRRTQEARQNNIYKKLVLYNGSKLPFPDSSFQTVISNCVFEHIPDLPNTLKEIRRVLKPGGYILSSVMTKKWEDFLFGKKIVGNVYVEWLRKIQEHHSLLSENQWDTTYKKCRLSIVK